MSVLEYSIIPSADGSYTVRKAGTKKKSGTFHDMLEAFAWVKEKGATRVYVHRENGTIKNVVTYAR